MDRWQEFLHLVASGFSGAVVAACMPNANRSSRQTMVFIIAGMLTAIWVTPLFAEWMGLTKPNTISGLSFAIGMCWQNVATKVCEKLGIGKAKDEGEANE